MNDTRYTSFLASYMDSYLKESRLCGHAAFDIQYSFVTIDRFFKRYGGSASYVDKAMYEAWFNTLAGYRNATIYQHVSVFRRLMIYMCDLGRECYIPRLPRQMGRERLPKIFSDEEMSRIFKACDSMRCKEHHSESIMIAIPALIRLLYSTGIRVSEALAIKNRDVNFSMHIITLRKTKNGAQRLAPINATMEAVLRQYILYRGKIPVENLDDPDGLLFVSSLGRPVRRNILLRYFHNVSQMAGIPYIGDYQGPRVHDIRHTACVHSMRKLASEGKDIYCSLPMLSVFMGHKKVMDTEYYLRLTADMYPELLKLDSSVSENIKEIIRSAANEDRYE